MSEDDEKFTEQMGSDPELQSLVFNLAKVLGIKRTIEITRESRKFNSPTTITDDSGTREDENDQLKRILQAVPPYVREAEQAGISKDDAYGILMHLLTAEKFLTEPLYVDTIPQTIHALRKAFENVSERNSSISEEEIAILHEIIEESISVEATNHAMYAYSLTQRMGLSTEQSAFLISKYLEADTDLAAQTISSFCSAIEVLNIAEIDPDLVVRFFDRLGGEVPYYNKKGLSTFKHMMTFDFPPNLLSPQKTLERIMTESDNTGVSIQEVLDQLKRQKSFPSSLTVLDPRQKREAYFLPKEGKLELAALPYRTVKPFNDGLRDLEDITNASRERLDTLGEGYWVFDQGSKTWYSLGGEAEVLPSGLRTIFPPYDLTQLSKNPILLHCHPKEFEVRSHPTYPREYGVITSKFAAATPSKQDYEGISQVLQSSTGVPASRSYIVHSSGITEFTYPADIKALSDMAYRLDGFKENALSVFDSRFDPDRVDYTENLGKLGGYLNRELPKGFSIKIYPPGHNFAEDGTTKKPRFPYLQSLVTRKPRRSENK